MARTTALGRLHLGPGAWILPAAAVTLLVLAAAATLGFGRWIGGIVASGGYAAEVELTDRDDGAMVKLAGGGELIVALASNPSTGYRWYVAGSPTGLAPVGEAVYVPPGSTSPVVGAPGTEVFTFTATKPGTVQLVLEYRRGFEPDAPPARTFRVTAEIQ